VSDKVRLGALDAEHEEKRWGQEKRVIIRVTFRKRCGRACPLFSILHHHSAGLKKKKAAEVPEHKILTRWKGGEDADRTLFYLKN